jgi:hypothetical protein
MAEEAAAPAVIIPVKLVADGSDYDGTYFVGDSVRDGKLLVGNQPDIDVFFVLISGYLVRPTSHLPYDVLLMLRSYPRNGVAWLC